MTQEPQAPPPDSVHAVLNDVFADPKYDWDIARSPLQFLFDLYRQLLYWFSVLEAEHPGVYWVVLSVLIVVLIVILTHFGYLVWRALQYRGPQRDVAKAHRGVRRDAPWYLAEARRLAAEGRRAESLGYRFRALVLELERRRALAFHPSKTPAEYVREAGLEGEARAVFTQIVGSLYRHLFGGEPVSDEDLDTFDRRAARLVETYAPI